MDSAEEKKWFIYVGDHHEGPFSVNDLRGKMSEGVISNTSYTWAEGMADWQLMTEVQALSSLFGKGITAEQASALALEVPALATDGSIEAIAPPVADSMAQPMSISLAESVSEPSSPRSSYTAASERSGLSNRTSGPGSALAMYPGMVPSVSLQNNPHLQRTGLEHPELLKGGSSSGGKSKSRWKRKAKKLARVVALLALVTGVGYGYGKGVFDPVLKSPMFSRLSNKARDLAMPQLLKLTEKAPFLAKWISPIPQLSDVSPDDYEELRQAAVATTESTGPKFGVAFSKSTAEAPVFYVTANLGDGARLRLVLSGVSDTLVDSLSFNQMIPVSLTRRLSKTDPLKANEGRLPRGQYLVTLVEAPENPAELKTQVAKFAPPPRPGEKPGTVRPLAAKSYFLGGAKDAAYAAQLKAFHDTLIKKAGEELLEAKAFSDHFEKQLAESNQRFDAIHKNKKIPPAKKKMWTDFHAKWNKSWAQMEQSFGKPSEGGKSDRFYTALYLQMGQVVQAVQKVHKFQDSLIAGSGDKKSLEIQVGEAESGANAAVAALKSRVEQIEKAVVPAGSIPLREDQISDTTHVGDIR